MSLDDRRILVAETALVHTSNDVRGGFVECDGEEFYRICDYDQMRPFLISLASSSDHWLFASSAGGLTAGRRDADHALFPYETEDKLTANSERSGSFISLIVETDGRRRLWEPFTAWSSRLYSVRRSIAKSVLGNALTYEETNTGLGLTFRYNWRTSERFGFVRTAELVNLSSRPVRVEMLDGLLGVLPSGATAALQERYSVLLAAYRRNEIDPSTGLGIFSLSATITDRAEPSEALTATVVWQIGLGAATCLLSPEQIEAFRSGEAPHGETATRGVAAAYLTHTSVRLDPASSRRWYIVADVDRDVGDVSDLRSILMTRDTDITAAIEDDVARGSHRLRALVARADGLQSTSAPVNRARHFANTLFNLMRGGVFADGYAISSPDFLAFLAVRNRTVHVRFASAVAELGTPLAFETVLDFADRSGSVDLMRLSREYLPLSFSRRHGDPSRPWNRFMIRLRNPDGTSSLDYQGNWRDIFQNWEALATAFPQFLEHMIARFLNATTADGYNPYRVTRDGFEWEVPEPDNPWSNIGYWSDHQIIYVQKLLEMAHSYRPGFLDGLWNRAIFSYANVPYRLRSYEETLRDWYNTVEFDELRARDIADAVSRVGQDGKLHLHTDDRVVHAGLVEKLLVLLLAKVANWVPEAGIWMNTQRPEWNDANNALVGKGLSVVTTAYLVRFTTFWAARLSESTEAVFRINSTVTRWFEATARVLVDFRDGLESGFDDTERRRFMDVMGSVATDHRDAVYRSGLAVEDATISRESILSFLTDARCQFEHALAANRRGDGMYHTYNVLQLGERTAGVSRLALMLEGQVAVLSSGFLSPVEAARLVGALRTSDLYRRDIHSYMLYPNRILPGFLEKNVIPRSRLAGMRLPFELERHRDRRLFTWDESGAFHFNGAFRNAADVTAVLDRLSLEPRYASFVEAERGTVLTVFEELFDHASFTGRSGTFFAYEGLGSVYWHMVSKLLLAVQEQYLAAHEVNADAAAQHALRKAYFDIRAGFGYNKSPADYGAFPTDPYSHSPEGGGARQPGMTGQVKEEILIRLGELGMFVRHGSIVFAPLLLQHDEFSSQSGTFRYVDVSGAEKELTLPSHSLAYTVCQVPVVYVRGSRQHVEATMSDGSTREMSGAALGPELSNQVFARTGMVRQIRVQIRFADH